MSEHSTPEERTEDPTDKRWGKLKEEGTLPNSTELSIISVLLVGFGMLLLFTGALWNATRRLMEHSFLMIAERDNFDEHTLGRMSREIFWLYFPSLFVLFLMLAVTAALSTLLQTNWNVKKKWIDPKWNMLNPVTGLKRIFSIHGLTNLGKAVIKLGVILPIGYLSFVAMLPEFVGLVSVRIPDILVFMGAATQRIVWNLVYVLIPLAIIDVIYTRYQWFKQNRMTKDEVKDERKATEGDESTKRQIRAKGLERAWQRITEAVPKADVVITNPTHYAIALKYDKEKMAAPIVVAKGKGHLALRIREVARESGVPMLQRRLLARSLYSSVKVGGQIPYELFKAVAEVLAYVYRLKSKRSPHDA